MFRFAAFLSAFRSPRRQVIVLILLAIALIFLFGSSGWHPSRSLTSPKGEHRKVSIEHVPHPHSTLLLNSLGVQHEALPGIVPTADARELPDAEIEKVVKLMDEILQSNTLTLHLFSQLTGPGERYLRDLAERSRLFKTAFDIWNRLHIHPASENIVPRLKHLKTLAADDAVHIYDKFRHFVGRLGFRLFPWSISFHGDLSALKQSYTGRGIVLTGGNHLVRELRTLILSLRKLGCNLPIELMYAGDSDLSVTHRHEFAKLHGVVTRDLSFMVDLESLKLEGWAIKPYAMLMSTFREIVFIDADAYFLTNPEQLFDTDEFRQTGTVFFKDRHLFWSDAQEVLKAILPEPVSHKVAKENRIWDGSSEHMQESGVVVVDKARHFVPMLVVARLNGPDRKGVESQGTKGLYDIVQGDKETFWLGWEMAGSTDYAFHPMSIGTPGQIRREKDQAKESISAGQYTVCSPQILHFDVTGRPMWLNGGLKKNKFDPEPGWQDFEAFVREPNPSEVKGRAPFWEIHEANVLCLKTDEYHQFSAEEKRALDTLLTIAKESELWAKAL